MRHPPPRFERFVSAFTALVDAAGADEPRILAGGRALLADLVGVDDWLPTEYAQPDPHYYRQYLLHLDPRGRFCVVSFVWGPGQKTPVHDHTVWGLIGMLRGAEHGEGFQPAAAGGPMRSLGRHTLRPGDVEPVSPAIGDIHQVANACDDRVSISIHVYGADIGRVARHVFDPDTGAMKTFTSGYANAAQAA
ncbi:cysteine dioxygenase [Aquincola sp. S2]|uniref:Cysteine dioxygenase n=1 Tax=Pseudaquabacterium terrae TaxID=2732868 RepID=A0ABX2ETW4_9BURK|nr:cysteine dioxygenase [Aquabacterium terrae]NRF72087.1 cysteine dioxygenase [Aquabacterium terrae]